MYEEVYNEYYDTAGNFHWTGTATGVHFVPLDGRTYIIPYRNAYESDKYMIAEDSKGIPQM